MNIICEILSSVFLIEMFDLQGKDLKYAKELLRHTTVWNPDNQWRTKWGAGGGHPSADLKNSGQTLISGQAQAAQKSWNIKNISIQWKISGQIMFSGQAQVAQNSEW